MIQIGLAGVIVFIVLQLLEKRKDRGIDGWVSLVLVPALIIFLLSIGIGIAGLPQELILLSILLYFLVPAAMLRFQYELTWGRASAYGGIVLVSAIASELVVSYGFAAISA